MNRPSDFLTPLHGLRGVAVTYVVLSHLGNAGLRLFPFPHDAVGKVGVWVFFGLSAYLLTSRLSREIKTTESSTTAIWRYAVHRVFRVYPLYVVALLLHALVGDMDAPSVASHLALMKGQGELWAIPAEFQYYLVIPLIAVVNRRAALTGLGVALAISVIYGLSNRDAVFSNELLVLSKAAPFLLASLLALTKWPPRFGAVVGWTSLALLAISTVGYRDTYHAGTMGAISPWLSLAIAVAVSGLIFALQQPIILARIFGLRPLVWLGEISFSIYLLHMFVIRAVALLGLPSMISAWLSLAGIVSLASLTFRYIERPGIEWGKRVARQPEPMTPQSAP